MTLGAFYLLYALLHRTYPYALTHLPAPLASLFSTILSSLTSLASHLPASLKSLPTPSLPSFTKPARRRRRFRPSAGRLRAWAAEELEHDYDASDESYDLSLGDGEEDFMVNPNRGAGLNAGSGFAGVAARAPHDEEMPLAPSPRGFGRAKGYGSAA